MKRTNILLSLFILANLACNDFAKKVESIDEKRISETLVNNPITTQDLKKDDSLPKLSFEKEYHNFGEIIQGKSVSCQFLFTNTGEGDLIISKAKGSCGCTVPEWPREPIGIDEKGIIKVTFNSTSKQGKQKKTITLVTNAIPNTKVLTITGQVIIPDKQTN